MCCVHGTTKFSPLNLSPQTPFKCRSSFRFVQRSYCEIDIDDIERQEREASEDAARERERTREMAVGGGGERGRERNKERKKERRKRERERRREINNSFTSFSADTSIK